MPTKTTSKSTTKKPSDASSKPKAGKGAAVKGDPAAPVKSLLPKITARAPKKEQPKEEPKAPEPPPKPKAEAVSLIDEKPKKIRVPQAEGEKKSLFVPISKVL